ncbi:hypothetical protein BDV95DRAFT_563992 [Massariosphaeria phaeospora]|uniref:Rhodopsin domain-containing protein n=1 Tax=Massariosphaeria phaeospora TaxID=100035 RepID=A0A7C8IB02_9PLEO|nr:hypothetical protein BDV95DRAFT_563992 [Massariosphaeria phaeospora]
MLSPTGPSFSLAAVCFSLLPLSYVAICLRLYVRVCILHLVGLDDWLMFAGQVLYTLACVVCILAAYNGVGMHSPHLNPQYQRAGRLWFFYFQIFYVASTVPIKASICAALLRITTSRRYKFAIWTVIGMSICAALATMITVLAHCQPIAATWDTARGSCAPSVVIIIVSYLISSTSIITDFSTSILAALILARVQLDLRVKGPVAVVLALGVFASVATIVRLKSVTAYSQPDDYLYGLADIATWSITESGIGIVAGSLATLRPLLEKIPSFRAWRSTSDVTKSNTMSRDVSNGHKMLPRDVEAAGRRRTEMNPITSLSSGSWDDLFEDDDDTDS